MNRQLPSLVWLRAFEASARHLSFTLAAHELGMTQTAISKQVKNLELHFREKLFERRPRSLILTKAGEAYLPKVRDAFNRLSVGTEEVFGSRKSEILTIRVSVGFSALWLGPRLATFRHSHPDIDFRIVSTVWNGDSDESNVDLEIRYGSGEWAGFSSDRLTSEYLFPICHPDLLKGNPPIRSPEDLHNHTLLHVDGYEEGWAIWLRAAGLENISAGQGLHFDTSIISFEMAASGCGIALGRSSLADHVIKKGELIEPFELKVPITEGFHVLVPEHAPLQPSGIIFKQWLLDQINKKRVA